MEWNGVEWILVEYDYFNQRKRNGWLGAWGIKKHFAEDLKDSEIRNIICVVGAGWGVPRRTMCGRTVRTRSKAAVAVMCWYSII